MVPLNISQTDKKNMTDVEIYDEPDIHHSQFRHAPS